MKKKKYRSVDKKIMLHCITLARSAAQRGRNPFGCIITKGGRIIAETVNGVPEDIIGHAEILALQKAQKVLTMNDLSSCTLYTNCEPCPMCAFMMREYKIGRVVFALRSPVMGGFTRWRILQDKGLCRFKPVFSRPPIVVVGVCKKEATSFFDEIGWTMHHEKKGDR